MCIYYPPDASGRSLSPLKTHPPTLASSDHLSQAAHAHWTAGNEVRGAEKKSGNGGALIFEVKASGM